MLFQRVALGVVFLCLCDPALAAESPYAIDGRALGVLWALPFVGILLSIALMPLLMPHVWHHHYGLIAYAWAAAFAVPYLFVGGLAGTVYVVLHTLLFEYIPFIILLFALYTVAGGIYFEGNLRGTPVLNTAILGIGTVLASFVGTTGASMILIRPLIRANDDRRFQMHTVVFFIFLVSNIGGSLTPLGDPPLFLGFLKGVDFFWTTRFLLPHFLFAAAVLLALYFLVDMVLHRIEVRDGRNPRRDPTPSRPMRLHGLVNFVLLGAIIATLLTGAYWRPGISVTLFHNTIELQHILRDVTLLVIAWLSLRLSPRLAREGNGFDWGPILEVGRLFLGIFITIIPVLAMLQAGRNGVFAPLVALVTDASGAPNIAMYFWLTGVLSSFLDNAPTYLVFFNLAGGDPQVLMTTGAATLTAISVGAVFMGANSYIGNAPNFMVKAVAEQMGVRTPSFFGYMLWSGGILVPIFLVMTVLFFRS
jgi:Na+/H+ antiporter NhaD/arsenite permease-like protein